MKKIIYLLSVLLLAAGCGQDDAAGKLTVDRTMLTFPAEGGEQTITVTTSKTLYFLPGDGWLSVQKGTKGGDGKTMATITAEPNEWPDQHPDCVENN